MEDFDKSMMKDLMGKNTSQQKYQQIIIPEINNMSDEDQAQELSDHFSAIPNEYNKLKAEDIQIEPLNKEDIPQFKKVEALIVLSQLKNN